ncbi:phosphoribosylanthranilate isomerase [Candidatus Omnitrophota bacterium]
MAKVKICGITNLEDAKVAQDAGADFLGFVFADSPRRIEADKARSIIENTSADIKIVALFVNEDKDRVAEVISTLGRVDVLQFHGDEMPEYCEQFKDIGIIKAFRIKDKESIDKISEYSQISYILLDAFHKDLYGGTGETFEWSLTKQAKRFNLPIFLSGGLNHENVKEAILKTNPFCVDVSSGVEKDPGKKDPQLVKKFIAQAKSVKCG